MKKTISIVSLILWMIVIFSFSSADANKSTGTSDKVITTMIEIKDKITNNETPNNEKEIIVKNSSFYIRKIAHITEYLILGFLMFNLLKQYSVTNIYYAIGLSILYSCTDEFHQLFISGRIKNVIQRPDGHNNYLFAIENELLSNIFLSFIIA